MRRATSSVPCLKTIHMARISLIYAPIMGRGTPLRALHLWQMNAGRLHSQHLTTSSLASIIEPMPWRPCGQCVLESKRTCTRRMSLCTGSVRPTVECPGRIFGGWVWDSLSGPCCSAHVQPASHVLHADAAALCAMWCHGVSGKPSAHHTSARFTPMRRIHVCRRV